MPNVLRFERSHRIRFTECDPAGIVFYPQYFVMFNNLLEAWVDSLLPTGFAAYILDQRCGMPTVRLEADFKSVCRMGDDVTLSLELVRLGNKSLTLFLSCTGVDGDVRMTVTQILVTTSLETHISIPIPEELSSAILRAAGSRGHPQS
jgi:4-hydroxybenzoyl-CoA thioesterase